MPYKQGWKTLVPLYFGSLAIGIICIVLAIFNADDSGGTIGGGGLPWRL